ncbi:OLC1v1023133C1 [Oldenlandia corymbosa var. corymbosa]|uniref:OLC1v1023133C1 n=1 Tax=Oldenlandia corymbosa var. corymbosa TaxID=529605 RepID=A0AAV1BZA6_OLDCO|nr:OLC1v1023133C1 [Oldenlandia corymbosa var. corymbosa]
MEEEYSVDPAQLLSAATEFANDPGAASDVSVKEFLDRFPLPAIINALQTRGDYPGLVDVLVDSLERVFRTKYGASLIPHYMPFIVVGLGADSQRIRYLACKTVSCLLENNDDTVAVHLISQYGVYPLLLDCLVQGDERVATASAEAIRNLAVSPKGLVIMFPSDSSEATNLEILAGKCSSMGRVRVLALIVKLFSVSSSVASVVYSSKLLGLLEKEVSNSGDTLVTLTVLELLYELAEVQHSTEFLSKTTIIQLLCAIISDASADSVLRSRAMMITGRLLSKENVFMFLDNSSFEAVISAISRRFDFLGSQDADECECALEALGHIGSSNQGATLLFSSSPPAARHVIDAAFDRQQRNKQLAALHSLANIVGEARNDIILTGDAEETLRRLIYEAASRTSKVLPSGLLLSVLQQDFEIRLAGYRLITGLVARPWCLMEIILKPEIIQIVTDTLTETQKIGMEARHNCCQAVFKSLTSSPNLVSDPAFAGVAAKLQEAIRRGPYLAKTRTEAQPAVMTAERF